MQAHVAPHRRVEKISLYFVAYLMATNRSMDMAMMLNKLKLVIENYGMWFHILVLLRETIECRSFIKFDLIES